MTKLSSITPVDTDKCVANVGNRFNLVLVAAQRARELRRGHHKLINTSAGPVIGSLQEIEAGLIGREYLRKV